MRFYTPVVAVHIAIRRDTKDIDCVEELVMAACENRVETLDLYEYI